MDVYDCPYMPRKRQPYAHASRICRPIFGSAARPVHKEEIARVKEAQEAMDDEFKKLDRKETFDWVSVQEWAHDASIARRPGRKIHVGRIFGLFVEKGHKLPKGSKGRKYKGRYGYQGIDVKDELATMLCSRNSRLTLRQWRQ